MYMKVLYAYCHLLELAAVSKAMPTSKVSLWTEFLLVHRHLILLSEHEVDVSHVEMFL